VIKILEAQLGQFLLGCNCPVRLGFVAQEQEILDTYAEKFFLQIALHLDLQRCVISASIFWPLGS